MRKRKDKKKLKIISNHKIICEKHFGGFEPEINEIEFIKF